MIKTTHIRLQQAAEMLATDADTLLIAATEGRITLYGLLNQSLRANLIKYDPDTESHMILDTKNHRFMFIEVTPVGAGDLLKTGETESAWVSSGANQFGEYWEEDFVPGTGFHSPESFSLKSIFLLRTEVQAISEKGILPPVDTVREPVSRGAEINRTRIADTTLTSTIAALLASWPSGKLPSGKDLERAASAVGINVSDDSIRKALDAARELAPSLKKPA